MAEQISGTTEVQANTEEVDPWAAAFAAIEQAGKGDNQETADSGANDVPGGELVDTAGDGGAEGLPASAENEDGAGNADDSGGLDTDAGDSVEEGGNAFASMFGVTEESIAQYEQDLNERLRDRAIGEIAQEFVKRGVRNRNGVLGATIDDTDVCKRDEDGVPRFYNPETGREFTGDNPRRQAQEWCDDYNKALADAFNKACSEYENHLRKESEPSLAVMKFAPKYEKLDDIRKGMFDNVIEDYEIRDNNDKLVGYSCDLDKALALVERQITMIQGYAKEHQSQQKPQPTGPVLDMKTSSGAIPNGNDAPPKSLAEAMERLQDAQLSKLKKN